MERQLFGFRRQVDLRIYGQPRASAVHHLLAGDLGPVFQRDVFRVPVAKHAGRLSRPIEIALKTGLVQRSRDGLLIRDEDVVVENEAGDVAR